MNICKWCEEICFNPDDQCGKCWGLIRGLKHALRTPKLFYWLKEQIDKRTKQIHEDGHF